MKRTAVEIGLWVALMGAWIGIDIALGNKGPMRVWLPSYIAGWTMAALPAVARWIAGK